MFSFSAFRILTLKGFYKRPNSECQRITKKENVPAFYAFVSSIQTILFLMEITSDSSTTSVEFICAFPVNWSEMRELYTGELTMCELCTGELSTCEQTFHNSLSVNLTLVVEGWSWQKTRAEIFLALV